MELLDLIRRAELYMIQVTAQKLVAIYIYIYTIYITLLIGIMD